VADWFAQTISTVKWEAATPEDKSFSLSAFPRKPGVESFRQALPEVLAQQLGGGGLSIVAGLWCRKHDVGALIFPSARTDSGVEIYEGNVVSHAGWNLVDYTDSDSTHLAAQIDLSDRWSDSSGDRITFHEVDIEYVDSGPSRGSWHVVGLKRRHEAHWRYNQAVYALNTYSEVLDKEVIEGLTVWLARGIIEGYIEQVGGVANLLAEALMGLRDSQQQVLDFAANSEREEWTTTAHALRAAVQAAAASH
jgi:hypothetical protein